MSFLDAENIPVAEQATFEFEGEDGVWAAVDTSELSFQGEGPVTVTSIATFFGSHAPDDPPASERYTFHLYPITSQLPAPVVRYRVDAGNVRLLWAAFGVRNRRAVESIDWPFDAEVVTDRHILYLRFRDPPLLVPRHEVGLARCQETSDISFYLNRDRALEVDRILPGGW